MNKAASSNRLAETELRGAAHYYESEALGLGLRFLSAVEFALAEILDHPLAGSALRGDVRSRRVGRFPHQLLYRRAGEEVASLPSCTSGGGRRIGPNVAE